MRDDHTKGCKCPPGFRADGVNSCEVMAQCWEDSAPEENEQDGSSQLWHSGQAIMMRAFSDLLQHAWLRSTLAMLSWSKKLVRKWFNIKGGDEWRTSVLEREHCTIKKTKTEKSNSSRSMERPRRGRVDLDHPQIINVHNYSVFVATWNVGGKSPSNNLILDDWLHSAPPADIYVLGFQEIVPLNAGNILGAEDNGPAKKWLSLIRKTLNSGPGISGSSSACYTPSPVPDPIAEWNADFEGSSSRKASSLFPRRSFQTPQCWRMENDPSISQPRLDRRYSVCDRVIFGHRASDFDPNTRWGHRPS